MFIKGCHNRKLCAGLSRRNDHIDSGHDGDDVCGNAYHDVACAIRTDNADDVSCSVYDHDAYYGHSVCHDHCGACDHNGRVCDGHACFYNPGPCWHASYGRGHGNPDHDDPLFYDHVQPDLFDQSVPWQMQYRAGSFLCR